MMNTQFTKIKHDRKINSQNLTKETLNEYYTLSTTEKFKYYCHCINYAVIIQINYST